MLNLPWMLAMSVMQETMLYRVSWCSRTVTDLGLDCWREDLGALTEVPMR